jgi:hypothetical protein
LIYGKDFFRNWRTYDRSKDPVFNVQAQAEFAAFQNWRLAQWPSCP